MDLEAGGSSFISGYTGCNAILSSSTSGNIISSNTCNHYSGKIFLNPIMKSGSENMINPKTSSSETGHLGNGYAKIYLVQ